MNVNRIQTFIKSFWKQTKWYHQHYHFSSLAKPILPSNTKSNFFLSTTQENKNFFKPASSQASTGKNEHQLSDKINISQYNTPTKNISKFYEGINVLITGSTGFVGKVLLERLLTTCNPEAVYLLIRPKKGISVEERTKQLLEGPVFNKLKEKNAEKLKKIKVFYGDLEQPNLALGEAERNMISDKVNIVLHSAANVRFIEKLQNIIITNTLGTKRITELCKEIKHLKSFVHVSTIFRDKQEVEEIIYDSPYNPDFMIDLVQSLPADIIESITPKLLKNHPHTYTLSKALAEKYACDCSKTVPTAIVRPSMVHSSWKEPFPGWVDRLISFTGISVSCMHGTLKILPCDKKIVADFIPVDVVADTIITAAWHTATYKPDKVKIYNCTSGQVNKITFGESNNFFCRFSRESPTKHVLLYPGFATTTNPTVFKIAHLLLHLVPAYIYDTYLYCSNRRPKTVKEVRATMKLAKAGSFCLFNNKTFYVNTFKALIEAVERAEDGRKFNINMTRGKGFDWESYMKDYMLGIRNYVLKDDLSTLPYAKTKLNRIYWTTKAVQVISLSAVVGLLLW